MIAPTNDEIVYRFFREAPDKRRSPWLYAHYRRGRDNRDAPRPSHNLALAAWRAGRDSAQSGDGTASASPNPQGRG